MVSPARELFTFDPREFELTVREGRNYDISADGSRFLMLRREGETTPPRLDVIVNWAAQLPSKMRE